MDEEINKNKTIFIFMKIIFIIDQSNLNTPNIYDYPSYKI